MRPVLIFNLLQVMRYTVQRERESARRGRERPVIQRFFTFSPINELDEQMILIRRDTRNNKMSAFASPHIYTDTELVNILLEEYQ